MANDIPNVGQHSKTGVFEDLETSKTWAEKSKEWAISENLVDDLDYSSKYWAGMAKEYAEETAGNVEYLGNLLDVTLTNPALDHVLTFDGTEWVNKPSSGGGGASNEIVDGGSYMRVLDAAPAEINANQGLTVNTGGQISFNNYAPINFTTPAPITLNSGGSPTFINSTSGFEFSGGSNNKISVFSTSFVNKYDGTYIVEAASGVNTNGILQLKGTPNSSGGGGMISLAAGDATGGNGGNLHFEAGDSNTYGGWVFLHAGSGDQEGGSIDIATGDSYLGDSGDLYIGTGDSGNASGGDIIVSAGWSDSEGSVDSGGHITLTSGSSDSEASSGDITIQAPGSYADYGSDIYLSPGSYFNSFEGEGGKIVMKDLEEPGRRVPLNWRFDSGEGDVNVILKPSETTIQNQEYILPREDGTAGQVLTTNGNGEWYFETVSGGGETTPTFSESWEAANEGILEDNKTVYNNGNGSFGYVWTPELNSWKNLYELDYSEYTDVSTAAYIGMNNGGDPGNGGTSDSQVDPIFQMYTGNGAFTVNNTNYPNDLSTVGPITGETLIGFLVDDTAKTCEVFVNDVSYGTLDYTYGTDPRIFASSGHNGYTGKIRLRVNKSANRLFTYGGFLEATIEDAPSDDKRYMRMNAQWVPFTSHSSPMFEAVNEGVLSDNNTFWDNGSNTHGYAWTPPFGLDDILYELDYSGYASNSAFHYGINNGGDPGNGGASTAQEDPIFQYWALNGSLNVSNPYPNTLTSYGSEITVSDHLVAFLWRAATREIEVFINDVSQGTMDLTTAPDPRMWCNSGQSGYSGTVKLRVDESRDPSYTYGGYLGEGGFSPEGYWNPDDKHADITLSNDNKDASQATGGTRGVRGVNFRSGVGKYQIRYIVSLGGFGGTGYVGVGNANVALYDRPFDPNLGDCVAFNSHGGAYNYITGEFNDSLETGYSEYIASSQLAQFDYVDTLLNLDDNEITFLVNDVQFGSIHTIPADVEWYPFAAMSATPTFRGDFTGETFTPEDGYEVWNAEGSPGGGDTTFLMEDAEDAGRDYTGSGEIVPLYSPLLSAVDGYTFESVDMVEGDTLEFTVNGLTGTSTFYFLFSASDTTRFYFRKFSSGGEFTVRDNSGYSISFSSSSNADMDVFDGEEHVIQLVFGSGNRSLIIDGITVGTNSTASFSNQMSVGVLGCRSDGGFALSSGTIYDVSIGNKVSWSLLHASDSAFNLVDFISGNNLNEISTPNPITSVHTQYIRDGEYLTPTLKPLAEGDVWMYNEAESKFKPTQISSGGITEFLMEDAEDAERNSESQEISFTAGDPLDPDPETTIGLQATNNQRSIYTSTRSLDGNPVDFAGMDGETYTIFANGSPTPYVSVIDTLITGDYYQIFWEDALGLDAFTVTDITFTQSAEYLPLADGDVWMFDEAVGKFKPQPSIPTIVVTDYPATPEPNTLYIKVVT